MQLYEKQLMLHNMNRYKMGCNVLCLGCGCCGWWVLKWWCRL